MALKGSRGSELSESVAYHILAYKYGDVLSAVMNGDSVTYHFRENCGSS